jgi:hypothetical protein
MSHPQRFVGRIAVLAACCVLTSSLGLVLAQEESVVVNKPVGSADEGPALAAPATGPTLPPLPPPARPATAPTAKQPPEPAVKRPFLRPVEPRRVPVTTALSVTEEPMPAPEILPGPAEGVEVRPTPPIEYDTDGDARRMYRRTGEVHLVMVAQNPADGCFYEIPLCVPACCTGEPLISSGQGIFGRGVVEYCWACGFRAEVKFRHVLGDVKVEYEGD